MKPVSHRSDAELILAVIQATSTWEGNTQTQAVVRPIRELLWAIWERPRLGETVRGKYPIDGSWSRAARRAYDADPTCPLILEHVTPANIIVKDLLRRPPRTVAALVRVLNRRVEHTVITPFENQKLMAAGVAGRLAPGSADGWDRYRVAGIDVRNFAALRS